MQKKFIFYIIVIIVILVVLFLSQQVYSRAFGKNLVSAVADQAGAYLSKGSDWVMSKIYPKINDEIRNRGEAIKNEIDQTKKNISENILEKVGNYFSGITNSIIRPGTPQNCQP